MTPWDALLDVFRGGLFTLTHLYGGSVGLTFWIVSRLASGVGPVLGCIECGWSASGVARSPHNRGPDVTSSG